MNDYQMQQYFQQMPQFTQGLLNNSAQDLINQGQQSAQAMAQQANAANQIAAQGAANVDNQMLQTQQQAQQAQQAQQQKNRQLMGLALNFIPGLGATGKTIGKALLGA